MNDFGSNMLRATFEFGQLAIKQLVLINGGGAIAILGYLGATASNGALSPFQRAIVSHALFLFAAGVGLGALTALLAYLGQRGDYEIASEGTRDWLKRSSSPAIAVAGLTALGSIACFAAGIFQFIVFLNDP